MISCLYSSLTLDANVPLSQHLFLSKLQNFEYLGTKRVKRRRKGKEEIDDQKKQKQQWTGCNTKHPEGTPGAFPCVSDSSLLPSNPSGSPSLNKHLSRIFTMETQSTD